MRRSVAMIGLMLLTACGGDTVSSETAAAASVSAQSRDAAQESRIDNPDALACIRASSTEGEWAIIARQDAEAEAMLHNVLNRESTIRCFNENNVVVYI